MLENNENNEDTTFIFNMDACVEDKTQPLVIRNLFVELQKFGYISVGDWFEALHNSDLDVLRNMVELIETEGGDTPDSLNAFESLTLLGMGLTFGEGMLLSETAAAESFQAVTVFVSVEYLARQGLVNAVRENWSMDPAVNKEIVKNT